MSIVLVEDDRVVTQTLELYLRDAGFDVGTAHDGPSGLELATRPDTELVILDLMVPGLSGLEICRRLRATSNVPILMLTARASEDDRVVGLDLGADDYVTKPFRPREVVARVHALLRRSGTHAAPPEPLRIGGLEVDSFHRQARLHGASLPLTVTEFRLLEVMAASPGRTFTREELIRRVFGPDFEGYDRTIDVHITNLRRKLGDARDYVVTAHGLGYRLEKEHRA